MNLVSCKKRNDTSKPCELQSIVVTTTGRGGTTTTRRTSKERTTVKYNCLKKQLVRWCACVCFSCFELVPRESHPPRPSYPSTGTAQEGQCLLQSFPL